MSGLGLVLLFFCYYAMPVWCHINQSIAFQTNLPYRWRGREGAVVPYGLVPRPKSGHETMGKDKGGSSVHVTDRIHAR